MFGPAICGSGGMDAHGRSEETNKNYMATGNSPPVLSIVMVGFI